MWTGGSRESTGPRHHVGRASSRAVLLFFLLLALPVPASAGNTRPAVIARVLDGDSVVLVDGTAVRYVGINAPEAGEPFAEAAADLNRTLVGGRTVDLVTAPRPRDGYGRLLAYVYADGRLVNAEMLRTGLAHLMIFQPLADETALAALERTARNERRGMWGAGGPVGPLKITAPRRRGGTPRSRPRVVTLCNIGGSRLALEGFVLEIPRARFSLPVATLLPGHVALIVLAAGRDRKRGPGPLRFHWQPAWPEGDGTVTLRLRDPAGKELDRIVLVPARSSAPTAGDGTPISLPRPAAGRSEKDERYGTRTTPGRDPHAPGVTILRPLPLPPRAARAPDPRG